MITKKENGVSVVYVDLKVPDCMYTRLRFLLNHHFVFSSGAKFLYSFASFERWTRESVIRSGSI